ncbi:DUF3631 domain-containing protein [Legionella sp.]|uniref:DUF3631 domain-containing protein n=1 Tax=Legionella sp. TaxID=459 RepID=UPI003CBE964D
MNFTTIINNTELAFSEQGVRTTDQYVNINGEVLMARLRELPIGEKDGSHFLRTKLKTLANNQCMSRAENNAESTASILMIDCDKGINQDGLEIEGAPDPQLIHEVLLKLNIGHIIYGSHSHYSGNKGNRCRIILATQKPYHKEQLAATAEALVLLINQNLDKKLLAYAKENGVFAQAWYTPRKPYNSNVTPLYFEYLNGNPVEVFEQETLPPTSYILIEPTYLADTLLPINAFNEQNHLSSLLVQYGYKKKLIKNNEERWLCPNSTSGTAGIVVRDNRFFSHHSNVFNDGYWHSPFDLMQYHENLTRHEAIIRAAQTTLAPNGKSVDEYNKSLIKSTSRKDKTNISSMEYDVIDDIEPWPVMINPNELLTEIENLIRRCIVCNSDTVIAATLWATMTWFMDSIQVAPLAVITAPEKRCGKSQLLFLFTKMVKNPLPASNITSAALFRTVDLWGPTLLIDEADSFIKDDEELRGILNCGHTRDSAFIIRTVQVGKDYYPRKFNVWGAKALAGIGHLSETLMDRAIILELRRKLPHEKVERLRHIDPNLFASLKSKLSRFAIDFSDTISSARPHLPEILNDRAQDNWEPLLAIADAVGGKWPEQARKAAISMSTQDNSIASIGTELLLNIQDIFEQRKIERFSTSDLIQALCSDDEQPWATYHRGQAITPRQLANLLKSYGIKSKGIRIGNTTPKGFEKQQFAEAFDRYLNSINPEICATVQQANSHTNYSVSHSINVAATLDLSATRSPTTDLSCCGVADVVDDVVEVGL